MSKENEGLSAFAPASGYATVEELLAHIHRDGGHYTAQHGLMRSFLSALNIIHAAHADKTRLDWIAEKGNGYAALQLPGECVRRNAHSMRAAIDDAMEMQRRESANKPLTDEPANNQQTPKGGV